MKNNFSIVHVSLSNLLYYENEICLLFNDTNWYTDHKKLKQLFMLKNANGFCALYDNKVIGFVFYIIYSSHAWTGYINVNYKFRHNGVATLLKKVVIHECKKIGIKTIRLTTRKELISLNTALNFKKERTILKYTLSNKKIFENNCKYNNLLSRKDIKKIISFDNSIFDGDRAERILKHVSCCPKLIWSIYKKNILKGFALAWKYRKAIRVGPVICDDRNLLKLMQNIFITLKQNYSEIDIVVYKDDTLMNDICNKFEMSCSNKEYQLLYSEKPYNQQHQLLRSVWGKATG